MTEQEVSEIIEAELKFDQGVNDAFMNAQRKIADKILKRLGILENGEEWKMLSKIVDANVRLGLFVIIPYVPGAGVVMPTGYFEHILKLYEVWQAVFQYFLDNYEKISCEKFKKDWPKEVVEESLRNTSILYQKHYQEIAIENKQAMMVDYANFSLMHESFIWGMLAILGEENFESFSKEVTEANSILMEYQAAIQYIEEPPEDPSSIN